MKRIPLTILILLSRFHNLWLEPRIRSQDQHHSVTYPQLIPELDSEEQPRLSKFETPSNIAQGKRHRLVRVRMVTSTFWLHRTTPLLIPSDARISFTVQATTWLTVFHGSLKRLSCTYLSIIARLSAVTEALRGKLVDRSFLLYNEIAFPEPFNFIWRTAVLIAYMQLGIP